jgi:DNA invertase Pin-like site-specific DNA recombinase
MEFERDLIRERTGAGREAAKKRSVRFGRPRKLNPDQAQVASQLLAPGKAVQEIARTFNVYEGYNLSSGCYFMMSYDCERRMKPESGVM